MKLKAQDIEIIAEEPFRNDALGLKVYADTLTNIVGASEDGLTLSINAGWGYGKTTFVKMWNLSLQNEGYTTVYLNAWETDFAKDPLLALMNSLQSGIDIGNLDADKRQLWGAVTDAIIGITKLIPGLGIVGTIGETAKKSIDDCLADTSDLQKFQSYMCLLDDFRQKFSAAVSKIAPNKPLVLFVDELDRCRPNYSVEMLERIKHFFAVNNVVFVLSIDKPVMLQAIRGVYNSADLDAESYLRRFIDLEFNLPEPKLDDFIRTLYQQHRLDECLAGYQAYIDRSFGGKNHSLEIQDTLCKCFQSSNLSLRDAEKYFNRLDVVFHAINMCRADKDFVIYLLYAYMFKPDAYALMTKKNTTEDHLMLDFETKLFDNFKGDSDANNYMIYIICLLTSVCCRQNNLQSLSQVDLSHFSFNYLKSKNLTNIYNAANNACVEINSDYIMNAIEMVSSNFNWNNK